MAVFPAEPHKGLAGGLATVSNFFLLEPNIAGIGINFNAIINYFARKP